MFQRLRWHLAKRRLASLPRTGPRWYIKQSRHRHQAADFPPNAEAYSRLASVWDDWAGWCLPGYARFLISAGAHYGRPIKCVLDLACGTGRLARRLAKRVESVVGLDASESMLRDARSRTKECNVRYVRGDFRDFRCDEMFDAIVCSSDSLNYVETPEQLTEVFRCVERHLSPGGLFAFDALDHWALRALVGTKVVGEVHGERFGIYYFYDPEDRVSEDRAVFEDAVERHRRMPIEIEDVRSAAGEARLVITDHFSTARWPFFLSSFFYVRDFYLLRKLA
jgi:SAM-dependent methyltransferase